MPISLDTEREIKAIRLTFNDDDREITDSQMHLLRILMELGLTDKRRKVRLHALRRITGLNLESSKQLTLGVASSLISYFRYGPEGANEIDPRGEELLSRLEEEAVAEIGEPRRRRKKDEEEYPW